MPSPSDLNQLQLWVQQYVRGSDASLDAVESIITPSSGMTSPERIGVYREMYLVRLVEALETDYPGLRHFLGAVEFARVVGRYVDSFPSRSYTLNRLGDHLPEFLGPGFAGELAQLELALSEVFDAEESPVLSAAAIAAVPPDSWESAVLLPINAFRLLSFHYPVSAYLTAVQDSTPSPPIRRKRSYVACYRRQYAVHRIDLTRPAFQLLTDLAAGVPLGKAVKTYGKQLFPWFQEWAAEGLFRAVHY